MSEPLCWKRLSDARLIPSSPPNVCRMGCVLGGKPPGMHLIMRGCVLGGKPPGMHLWGR